MLNVSDILETINMIREENLDIRTITMGISLLDCVSDDENKLCDRIYDKITKSAENLVSVGCDIEKQYGVPIVNKRVSVTPVSLVGGRISPDGYVKVAKTLQRAAETLGINFIGGFSALVHKGMTPADRNLIAAIPQALSETEMVCSSVNVASSKAGINMDAIALMGDVIKETAYITRDRGSIGCAKLVVFANAVEDNPFMAGAFHGVGEPECVLNVGVSGPGVVYHALQSVKGRPFDEVAETIKKTAFRITRMGQIVGVEASKRLGVPFGIVDLSLAPTPAVGDSVARILEEMGLEVCGCHGTTAALALLNDEDTYFLVLGKADEAYREELKKHYPRTVFGGFIPSPQHLLVTQYAKIGIANYDYSCLNNLFCAPNKIYEYAKFGMPMLTSTNLGLTETVGAANAAVCVDFLDVKQIAEGINKIKSNYELYSKSAIDFYEGTSNFETIKEIVKEL